MSLHNYEYQSDFAKKYMAEGEEKGREEGRKESLSEFLIELVQDRFGEFAEPVRERIEVAETDELKRWAKRCITAANIAEVFQDE